MPNPFINTAEGEETTLDLTVLIPVHNLETEDDVKLLEKAIKSIGTQKYNIKSLTILLDQGSVKEFGKISVNALVGKAVETNIQNLEFEILAEKINNCGYLETTWFTILQQDDQMLPDFTEQIAAQIEELEEDGPTMGVILPLVAEVDVEGRVVYYANTQPFSAGLVENYGKITREELEREQLIQTAGAVFNTEAVRKAGGFKKNLPQLVMGFEMVLRLLQRGCEIQPLGRVLYAHSHNRPGSYSHSVFLGETPMAPAEVAYWFERARSEAAFSEDRPQKPYLLTSEEVDHV